MNRAQKALYWARYLRGIEKRRLAGKVLHEAKLRLTSVAPSLLVKAPEFDASRVDLERLARFSAAWAPTAERFSNISGLDQGRFETNGALVDFGAVSEFDWTPRFADKPELSNWAYDFASFSYARVLVARDAPAGAALLAQMVEVLEHKHSIGNRRMHFVWNPISVSLRALGLLAAIGEAHRSGVPLDGPELQRLARHVFYCAAFLRTFAERYLGYNHEAFALVTAAVVQAALSPSEKSDRIAEEALSSIASQVMSDGLQAERTATYHIHVLMLARALSAARALGADSQFKLDRLIDEMTRAIDVLVHPDGEIALFNDAAVGDAVSPRAIGWSGSEQRARTILPEAGFTKLARRDDAIIFDAGPMGDDNVVGHAHADFLSCEISLGGRRVIVDPGVFAYKAGELRDATRSARSHNGPGYEGLEPAELFGAWRVGRRGRAHLLPDLPGVGDLEAAGIADGYSQWSGSVGRYACLREEGALLVDFWRPIDAGEPRLRFLTPDAWRVSACDERGARLHDDQGELSIRCLIGGGLAVADAQWRPRGPMLPAKAKELRVSPVRDGSWFSTAVFIGATDVDADVLTAMAAEVRRWWTASVAA